MRWTLVNKGFMGHGASLTAFPDEYSEIMAEAIENWLINLEFDYICSVLNQGWMF